MVDEIYALSFTMVKDKALVQLSGVAMGLTNMLIVGIGGLVLAATGVRQARKHRPGPNGVAPLRVH